MCSDRYDDEMPFALPQTQLPPTRSDSSKQSNGMPRSFSTLAAAMPLDPAPTMQTLGSGIGSAHRLLRDVLCVAGVARLERRRLAVRAALLIRPAARHVGAHHHLVGLEHLPDLLAHRPRHYLHRLADPSDGLRHKDVELRQLEGVDDRVGYVLGLGLLDAPAGLDAGRQLRV